MESTLIHYEPSRRLDSEASGVGLKHASNASTLEHRFTKCGWDFSFVDRSEHWAVYEKSKPAADSSDYDIIGWEVFRIRKNNKLPVSHGFACSTLEQAMEKFLLMNRSLADRRDEVIEKGTPC